MNKLTTLFSQA